MHKPVTLDTHDHVRVITINNPPVNALSPGVPEGISAALDEAERRETFTEFDTVKERKIAAA